MKWAKFNKNLDGSVKTVLGKKSKKLFALMYYFSYNRRKDKTYFSWEVLWLNNWRQTFDRTKWNRILNIVRFELMTLGIVWAYLILRLIFNNKLKIFKSPHYLLKLYLVINKTFSNYSDGVESLAHEKILACLTSWPSTLVRFIRNQVANQR